MMLSEDTRLLILRLVERCRDDGPAMAAVVEHLMGREMKEAGAAQYPTGRLPDPHPDTDLLDWLESRRSFLVSGNFGKVHVSANAGLHQAGAPSAREAIRLAMGCEAPVASAPPHPDTVRLDWLQHHRADVRESGGAWWVHPFGLSQVCGRTPDVRSAIDRAIKSNGGA